VGALTLLRSHRELLGLAACILVMQVANQSLGAVLVLYGDYRYGWTQDTVGFLFAGFGISSAIVGWQTQAVVRRLGDRRTMLLGLACGMAGLVVFALAPNGAIFMGAGLPLLALWGLAGPPMTSLMSRRVRRDEQGQLQGANSSINGIAGLIGPGLFNLIFARSIAPGASWHLPGAPFLLASFLMTIGIAIAWWATRPEAPVPAHA
jgi:DHA1 family tetracycline resistance protein-like MFS transporter